MVDRLAPSFTSRDGTTDVIIRRFRLTRWLHDRALVFGDRTLGALLVRMTPTLASKNPPKRVAWLAYVRLPWHLRFKPTPPWPDPPPQAPASLQTSPVVRNTEVEEKFFAESPVMMSISAAPRETLAWIGRKTWNSIGTNIPNTIRNHRRMAAIVKTQPVSQPPAHDAEALTREIHEEARRLGINAVGFAPFDSKYVFAGADKGLFTGGEELDTGTVIVCVLEEPREITAKQPFVKNSRQALRVFHELAMRASSLAEFVQSKGFRALPLPTPFSDPFFVIQYAVQAGLGQLGLNGLLLTPHAGPRVRLTAITTNAELINGRPIDYGVPAICDSCGVCVRRCPSSAITNKRQYHRGVLKAQIRSDRCVPTVMQAGACGLCVKTCPVHLYGLEPVRDHLLATGEILGKGSDELEGYDWIDGRHYGPGERPKLSETFLRPPGITFEPLHWRPDPEQESLEQITTGS
jgi:ferredoxin